MAFTRTRKRAVLHCLCHFPSMAITLVILSLSFGSTFWQGPDLYTNTVLSLLQYVAKIHEALIYMSLTGIILHRIIYDMTGDLGVPFGLLTSSLQLSSLTFLSAAEFRSGAFTKYPTLPPSFWSYCIIFSRHVSWGYGWTSLSDRNNTPVKLVVHH